MPDPNSIKLAGSGVVPVVLVVLVVLVLLPRMVNDSEGIVPADVLRCLGRTVVFVPVHRVAASNDSVLQIQPVASRVKIEAGDTAGFGADIKAEPIAEAVPPLS